MAASLKASYRRLMCSASSMVLIENFDVYTGFEHT